MNALAPPESTLLFRVCCFPVDALLEGGNPALFALCEQLERLRQRASDSAAALSSETLRFINAGSLARPDSKRVGSVAGRLGRGVELRHQELCAIDEIVSSRDAGLATRLYEHVRTQNLLRAIEATVSAAILDEPARLAGALLGSAAARSDAAELLRHRNANFFAVGRDGHDAEYWSSKNGRRNSSYLYSVLTRAALRTVPRDWHTQVALLPLGPSDSPFRTGRVASVWTENLHALRRRLSAPRRDEDARLGLSPLHWQIDDARIVFCVTDLDKPAEVREVDLRRSPFLDKVIGSIGEDAPPLAAVVERIADGNPDERELARGFVDHLVGLGAVVPSSDPKSEVAGWAEPALAAAAIGAEQAGGYLDVFAEWTGGVPREAARAIERGFATVARLANLVDAIAHTAGPTVGRPPEGDRPLVEVVRESLLSAPSSGAAGGDAEERRPAVGEWVAAPDAESPYTALLTRMREHLNSARTSITAADLDALGVPAWRQRWPVDVMVRLARPGAGYLGAFDEAFAAGSMDARFIAGARELGLPLSHHGFYQRFLDELGRLGADRFEFVELLFPPLSLGAANAVRRPAYFGAWTGDPDWRSYFTGDVPSRRYVPLDQLRLRATPRGRRILHGERLVLPMYHATRLPIAPWNILSDLFLNAAPFQLRWAPRRLHRLLDAFPDAVHAPRLEVDEGLVISPEQWRLPRLPEWRSDDSVATKAAALTRLRHRLCLPRLVFVSPGPFQRPVACDLDSIEGIASLEAVLARAADPIALRMTPGVGETLLRDRGDLSSTAMLRLPLGEEPEALAARLVGDLV